jgi:D-glycero-alpha-D-manno-heptose-7-phosphate kinase
LNALYTFQGEQKSSQYLADKACQIEIDILNEPIGKQDQYAAAFGGINYFQFNADGTTLHQPISLSDHQTNILNKKLLMFYTGTTRSASEILSDQKKETRNKLDYLHQMRGQAEELKAVLLVDGITRKFGDIIHQGWLLKKELSNMISNNTIEQYYLKARAAGAIGGKILGAGGGGFLLFYCDESKQECVRNALKELREIDFHLAKHGSRIIYIGAE